jgi:hypothetical protein
MMPSETFLLSSIVSKMKLNRFSSGNLDLLLSAALKATHLVPVLKMTILHHVDVKVSSVLLKFVLKLQLQ